MKKLVLENHDGQVARTFAWNKQDAVIIRRLDTRRVEIYPSTDVLTANEIKFEELGNLTHERLLHAPLQINAATRLRLIDEVGPVATNVKPLGDDRRMWHTSLIGMLLVLIGIVSFLVTRPPITAKQEAELKQELVQIVKHIPVPKPVVHTAPTVTNETREVEKQVVKTTVKTASIKRMGALAVLGSLSKSKQRGGVDLGAVNTTAGPGLGGNAGSGGVQTSLYGRGLVAAPVGAGGNLQGGGGYGTKGKGGGQAGYGKLSLVGSAGTDPIPLGREAIVEGGLDRELISDVINKNIGQIRFCYEQGLQGTPSLGGRVAVNFVINGNGHISSAGIENTTLNSKIVEDCILMRLRSWKFPLPSGGVDVKVSYPFVLRRTGQG